MSTERLITLEAWARAEYGDAAPSKGTLWRWVREGKILPRAEKHGRQYFVLPTARYVKHPERRLMKALYGTQTSQSRET